MKDMYFLESINQIITNVDSIVWGPATIIFLVGVGIYLTIRLGFIQLRGFFHSIQLVRGKYDHPDDEGDINHFQALSSALAATIGTGNIAGVATAISLGGPGALFWMWVTAFVGMATKYTSCTLSQLYRNINKDGSVSGGPMYYLERGLGQRWLGMVFAAFTVIAGFGIGNMVQANSVAQPLYDLAGMPKWISGLIMMILAGSVILGGIKRIATVTSTMVPFMSLFYFVGAFLILTFHANRIPDLFSLIFYHAFQPTSAVGGFAGATVMESMRYGVARGIFSNEAGLGSAPIAHAAAKTKEPVREGLVASLEPFIDTLVICTMTGLVILLSGLWNQTDAAGVQYTGATLSALAFDTGLPVVGKYIVPVGIVLFAFSTILGWSYYGDRAVEYLFGSKSIRTFHIVWILAIPVGAVVKLNLIWSISDVANIMMAAPNLVGLILLSGVAARETKEYYRRKTNGDFVKS